MYICNPYIKLQKVCAENRILSILFALQFSLLLQLFKSDNLWRNTMRLSLLQKFKAI